LLQFAPTSLLRVLDESLETILAALDECDSSNARSCSLALEDLIKIVVRVLDAF
jgi:hypothetical protein